MILARILRWAVVAALGRAWAQKSPRWLTLALALLAFRLVDLRAIRKGEKRRAKRAA